ncbi:hypothetical protein [Oceaniglobus trochenteri]|uniref:hypothetical protein n=1 Tax=Oceaniglobus trochenteri TaxID=2763260 RepID=UPI001CFF8C4B|nr:hypothetical protein [Oceaniglobus trochenteri]
MSILDCIQRAVSKAPGDGGISPARARAFQKLLEDRTAEYAHLGPGAEMAAAEDVWVQIRTDFQKRRRSNLLQAQANIKTLGDIAEFRDADGTANAAQAIRQKLEWGQSATFDSASSRRDALMGQYRRMIQDFIGDHARNIIGSIRNKARLPDIVRELHGEATGNPAAKQVADGVRKALEQARLDFNAAGGAIGKLADFGLPHSWNRHTMLSIDPDRKVARQKWTADVGQRLDWDRIVDHDTGKPFSGSSPAARQSFLEEVFDTITETGWNKREPSGMAVGKSTANRRSDARVLHFKSADDWMAMNEAYGREDPFTAILSHLDSMARDTALMQVLGPNPQAGLEFAKQTAAKLAAERPWKPSRFNWNAWRANGLKLYSDPSKEVVAAGKQSQRMLDLYTGAANAPEMDVVASAFSGARHFLIASQLGGAMLSAVTDVGFMGLASKQVGLDASKVIGRHVKALASTGQRQLMARAGIVFDSAANVGVAQARLMGDAFGPKSMERLSEFTMRASGLTAWTDIGRGAFRLEFYGLLAENAGRAWDDIDAPLRQMVFERRGITRADWDDIRSTALFRDQADPDASFLIPSDIRHRTDLAPERAMDLSLKLDAAILEQMEFAIPSASLRGRATMHGGAPGSLMGELSRSGIMYKSFMFSLMFNQLGRALFHQVNGSRAAYIVGFATITTVAGAVSMQLKEIAKGRDPRDMTDPKFWPAAAIQGGGFGIIGDFVYASENRFGGGLAQTIAGPMVGAVNDGIYLTNDIVKALAYRDQKHRDRLGRASVKFLDRFSGPTNLWYTNLALNRMLWDNLQSFVDSDAEAAWRRAEKKRVREFGNESWAPPGGGLPDRLPDPSAAVGADRP